MNPKLWARRIVHRLAQLLAPKPDKDATIRALTQVATQALKNLNLEQTFRERWAQEDRLEWIEARQFAGSGPWLNPAAQKTVESKDSKPADIRASLREDALMKESSPAAAQGAFGDIELALQNVEWRREINLSWLEFSRWGIQQIILISRLYYIKNPIIRRLINVCAVYVFGRGVEITSEDPDANEELKRFLEKNKRTLGQVALTQYERQKMYDGNLFFAFFPDKLNTGEVNVRTIDATEIMDVIHNPDDTDQPWYYRRVWVSREFDQNTGQITTDSKQAYYPALNFEPETKPKAINQIEVIWEVPIYHRKSGTVAKWNFGCPEIYPAIDWAKASRRFLEACSTVKQALATFAMTIQTKGGQTAIEAMKAQLATTVGPSASLWDQNPTPVNASLFISGPGTEMNFLNATGKGGDPEEVRQFKLMAAMPVGVPETFLGDVKTGNLATATSLDRPTELVFIEKQECWREDLVVIATYALQVSKNAPGSKFREALLKREQFRAAPAKQAELLKELQITEAPRATVESTLKGGRNAYLKEANKVPGKKPAGDGIQVMVTFPAIREGDLLDRVKALVAAGTLDNTQGQIVGIDERALVFMLLKEVGYEQAEELIEEMYPEDDYDPDRTQEPEPPAAPPVAPAIAPEHPEGNPISASGQVDRQPLAPAMKEAAQLRKALNKLFKVISNSNGDSQLTRT